MTETSNKLLSTDPTVPHRMDETPFRSYRHINGRLDAVSELSGALSPEADASRALLKKLPDVERLLSRVHSMASKHRSSDHPESRAIMYEDTKYSIRKVRNSVDIYDNFTIPRLRKKH